MKTIILSAAAMLTLGACASGPSAFGPATPDSRLGFETTQIENDRFRVVYTARTAEEAQDFALLRAAQIAEQEGYSHFKIITGSLSGNGPSSPVSTSVGIGTGRYYGRSRSNVGVGINVGDVGRLLAGDQVTNRIEIRLVNTTSGAPDTYAAKGVIDNIRPEVFK